MQNLEHYFEKYRKNIIGYDQLCPDEKNHILYADWIASGRLYRPIEDYLTNKLGPYVANTHTETTLTGTTMTDAYHQAHHIIKKHVNADKNDVLLFAGFGMTATMIKFQRILGLKVPEQHKNQISQNGFKKPLVLITHMEHHSNQTSWVECLCDVEIIDRSEDGLCDLNHMRQILEKNKDRELIIGSFSACSNVTGIETPIHLMAEIIHEYGGYCFADYAASAPYCNINMHPSNPKQKLDAVLFSPHKFLGGPGGSGVLIFDKALYKNLIPDHPGGGTVKWTNPWGEHRYFDDIETREDGGTPGFLQAIKAALAILLKEEMGVENILNRESELKSLLITELKKNSFVQILEGHNEDRLGVISFYSLDKHHNLIVKLLNDYFGIQTRGGCSCAGTYGHILLNVDTEQSKQITDKIDHGDLSDKPGWVRISLHPTMTNAEVIKIGNSVNEVIEHYDEWSKDYQFIPDSGEFTHNSNKPFKIKLNETFKAF